MMRLKAFLIAVPVAAALLAAPAAHADWHGRGSKSQKDAARAYPTALTVPTPTTAVPALVAAPTMPSTTT
ncbi:MAG: hypothetical protein QOD93_3440, partial [Acetobacteraceae bacterium]|nr:hypothetical protein [Acetobacteraceae bacterium]